MTEANEHAEEIDPDETADNLLEPTPDFGEQEEVAQKQEWEEDAREGGE
ncbi:MAG TPA: hypothetical protein VNA28_10230 [Solirubrobacteraceae bacterium]|nr:hypothetical protein [Solirubrobacteraceae bacterium]